MNHTKNTISKILFNPLGSEGVLGRYRKNHKNNELITSSEVFRGKIIFFPLPHLITVDANETQPASVCVCVCVCVCLWLPIKTFSRSMFDMTEQDWLIKAENGEERKTRAFCSQVVLCVFLLCGLWHMHTKAAQVDFGVCINSRAALQKQLSIMDRTDSGVKILSAEWTCDSMQLI